MTGIFSDCQAMPRPIRAHIHTTALQHNLARVCAAAPDAKVWAVVKANAYGHGIERVFDGLRGADGFALLDLSEAERVRQLGWRGPVLLLEGVFGRVTWSCARAFPCGMPCTATSRSTCWRRTRRRWRTAYF